MSTHFQIQARMYREREGMIMGSSLEQTNRLDAPPVCSCITWARDADDVLREHHPNCPQGNVVGFYVSILRVQDETTRGLLLRQFIEENFPTAYTLLTGEEARTR